MLTGLESPTHILLLLVLVLLFFGAKRLPEIGRSLGTGMRELVDGITGKSTTSAPTVTSGGETPAGPAAERDDRERAAP